MSPRAVAGTRRNRRPTATATFGSSRREAHDASPFYDRFVAPELSTDTTVNRPGRLDVIHHGDARDMAVVASDSVALVVTSPPYFAGKAYEEDLGVGGVPADYFEYLDRSATCSRSASGCSSRAVASRSTSPTWVDARTGRCQRT